jgi:ketosteroid isomerase-like protein
MPTVAKGKKGVHREMRRSAEVRDALLRFYEVFSAGDLEEFAHIIAKEDDEGVLVIGTDPGDWAEGRERWIAAREALTHAMEGLRLEAGEEPQGYEEGSMGWAVDRPRAVLPDGTISTRLTGVVHQEEGEWRLVHIHLSVGVPDEEVVELQKRWLS